MPSARENLSLSSWDLLNQLTDEELASELLAGEHEALAVLFDRYHKLVFCVALRIVGDSGEAEEVVQSVFLEIFRAAANFDRRKGTLRVWLLQCAYARALNRRRHLAATHFYDSVSLDADSFRPSSYPNDSDVAELPRLMEELLAALSPRRRAVVELTYFEGLTANEISDHLSLPVVVVRHELYRGLAKLRQMAMKTCRTVKDPGKTRGREALAPDAQAL